MESSILYHIALCSTVVLLAVALRFYKLGTWSFWIDEIYSLQGAQTVLESGLAVQQVSTLLMSASIQYFGVSEWSMRLAPAIIGLITLPILYMLVQKLFDRQIALLATLLLAISPWHLFWSQSARLYTTLFLFYLVAMIAFYWGMEKNRPCFLVLALVLLALAILERLFATFLIPVVVGYLLLLNVLPMENSPPFRLRWLLPTIVAPVLIFGIYEIFSFAASGRSTLLSFLVKFVGNPNKSSVRFLASFVYQVGIPTLLLGSAGGLYLIARKKSIGLYLLTAAVLPVLLLTLATPFIFTADRYAFITLPAWIILSAVAVRELFFQVAPQARILALMVPLILVGDALAQNVLYYAYQNGGRHNWKSAYALIEREQGEDDVVIASRPEIGTYYLGRSVQGINQIDRQAILQSGGRTWFVVNEDVDPNRRRWIESHAQLIQVLDVYIPGKFMSLYLYLYDPAER